VDEDKARPVVERLLRDDLRDEATRLACAVLDAAEAFSHQLPEVFAGFACDDANAPIRYPDALTPQSWAAGAPLLALRTLLGLEHDGGELRFEPHLPERYEGLRLEGVPFRVSSAA
jgi:glycogen debranching enzyme